MPYTYDFTHNVQPVDLEGYYWLNGERLSQVFCHELPSRMADLIEVALAVYAADRRSPRTFSKASTGQRRIHIRLAVRDPDLWASSEVSRRLGELLSWVSEDHWTFEFVRQALQWAAESKGFLFHLPPERPAVVSLFSGGLDSLAGLAAEARRDSDRSFVLVSGYTHGRLQRRQQVQVESVRRIWRDGGLIPGKAPEILHVAVPYGMHPLKGQREEKGQRTRAFVFLTLGTAAALQAGADALWVYENGVGALNLPLNETQLGVDNYRGVHPLSLMKAGELFRLVLEQPIQIRNPFLFQTKAEMCRAVPTAGLAELVRDTVSCDGFPQRVVGHPQCGYCTSCVLRRESLHAAGLGQFDVPSGYRHDVLNGASTLTLNQIYGLEAMLDQVEKLSRCLRSERPWQALAASFPQIAAVQAALTEHEGASPEEVRTRLIRMYRAYVQEWEAFPVNARMAA